MPSNASEKYEELISLYLSRGYKMRSQTDNMTELRTRISVAKYILCLIGLPFIINFIIMIPLLFLTNGKEAQGVGGFIIISILVFAVSLISLIAGRGKSSVFIRITKTGNIDITGNLLAEHRKK